MVDCIREHFKSLQTSRLESILLVPTSERSKMHIANCLVTISDSRISVSAACCSNFRFKIGDCLFPLFCHSDDLFLLSAF